MPAHRTVFFQPKIVPALVALALVILPGPAAGQGPSGPIPDSFESVLFNIDRSVGDTVIWGGRVGSIVKSEGRIEISMVQIPLKFLGTGDGARFSKGRFIVYAPGDSGVPELKNGSLAIVTGTVQGSATRHLGVDNSYTYPVVNATALHPCYRAAGRGYAKSRGLGEWVAIEGPFCVDPESDETHSPSEHDKYD